MTLTVFPPAAGAARRFGSAVMTRVACAEATRSVIVLGGEAECSTKPVMSDVLLRVIALRTGDVVIDLSEMEFIDTASVRALAVAQLLLERSDRTLSIRSPSRLAARLLHLFGLADLIEFPELAEA